MNKKQIKMMIEFLNDCRPSPINDERLWKLKLNRCISILELEDSKRNSRNKSVALWKKINDYKQKKEKINENNK